MARKVRIVGRAVIILALALAAWVTDGTQFPSASAQAPASQVPVVEKLTVEQLDALPHSQVVEFRGERLTKGELPTRMEQKHSEAMVKARLDKTQASAVFGARRAQFLREQEIRLQTKNVKILGDFTRLRPEVQATFVKRPPPREAIRLEASQLMERAKTASPEEQKQIERRAGELLRQLEQLGR